jgi:hypothetical protein
MSVTSRAAWYRLSALQDCTLIRSSACPLMSRNSPGGCRPRRSRAAVHRFGSRQIADCADVLVVPTCGSIACRVRESRRAGGHNPATWADAWFAESGERGALVQGRTPVAADLTAPLTAYMARVDSRRLEKALDCADIFRLVLPDEFASVREVGTTPTTCPLRLAGRRAARRSELPARCRGGRPALIRRDRGLCGCAGENSPESHL